MKGNTLTSEPPPFPHHLVDKPDSLPEKKPNGEPLKSLVRILLDRRATSHFTPETIPENYLNAIMQSALQAPSGYNLQPWRFIVVRDLENKNRLRKVAFDQAKVTEAPVVIIALGAKKDWRSDLDTVVREGAERGAGKSDRVERAKKGATDFLSHQKMEVWVTRHTMIAVTSMMLMAEAYGFDTAPMEGFDPEGVKREFGIPDEMEVVALLAIGRAAPPDKPYPGRYKVEDVVYGEKYGVPFTMNEEGRRP